MANARTVQRVKVVGFFLSIILVLVLAVVHVLNTTHTVYMNPNGEVVRIQDPKGKDLDPSTPIKDLTYETVHVSMEYVR